MIALLYTHSQQRTGKGINIITELRIGACIVKLSITESILIREFFTDTVKDVRESVVEYPLLRPGVLTVASEVCLE